MENGGPQLIRYTVELPVPAPPELRVALELGSEEGGYWASVPELQLTSEGEHLGEAVTNLVSAIREWLTYLQEEAPALGRTSRDRSGTSLFSTRQSLAGSAG